MKKRNLLVGFISTCILATACNGTSQSKSTPATNEPQKEEIYGQYEGIFPAADCEGIKTILVINSDKTYYLRSEYIGEEDAVFETNGVYNRPNNALIELVAPSSGEKTYYKVVANGIMLSDSLGTETKSNLAEHYILKKK